MADGERSALGLSVGATNFAAVTADRAVTRRPVLTLYRQRPPEVGVPSENPKLNEPGLVLTDFVNGVGNPAGIVAADGTTHRSETLIADALRALAYTATDGRALPDAVAVTHPAHWAPAVVESVRLALTRVSEWTGGRLALVSDYAATLVALRANPGIPTRGIIAVCDFGGTGTSLTLVDAASGYQPIAATVRHAAFSGDLIDQALLTHVLDDLSSAGSFDTSTTSAIGSLAGLRAACRHAKEELSSVTATTLSVDVPGYRGDIRLTREELDDAIRQSLDGFLTVVEETLERNGIRAADLVAAASAGGVASLPTVTTALSEHLRVPVITTPRPLLTAAIGAALRAAHGPDDEAATAVAATAAGSVTDATTMSDLAVPSERMPALAWSEAGDDSDITPIRPGEYPDQGAEAPLTSARPSAVVDRDSRAGLTGGAADVWYRRPIMVAVGTALAVLAVGAAVMLILHHTGSSSPSTPTPSVSTAPAPSGATDTQAPANSPTSSTESDTGTPPSTTTTTTTTLAPTTTTQAPTSSQTSSTTSQAPGPFPGRPGGPRGFG
ncbi:MAG: Hsp70 family protein [Mycobacterium sp.]|nr:Hsp70 family protein [Mycobacterium sp.]